MADRRESSLRCDGLTGARRSRDGQAGRGGAASIIPGLDLATSAVDRDQEIDHLLALRKFVRTARRYRTVQLRAGRYIPIPTRRPPRSSRPSAPLSRCALGRSDRAGGIGQLFAALGACFARLHGPADTERIAAI